MVWSRRAERNEEIDVVDIEVCLYVFLCSCLPISLTYLLSLAPPRSENGFLWCYYLFSWKENPKWGLIIKLNAKKPIICFLSRSARICVFFLLIEQWCALNTTGTLRSRWRPFLPTNFVGLLTGCGFLCSKVNYSCIRFPVKRITKSLLSWWLTVEVLSSSHASLCAF